MKRFVEGEDRRQAVLLPEYLDDYVSEENPVRVIDVFVSELDLGALGFAGVVPEATGRPAYHPGVLLKIYVYGYINQIASSRRLERESQRNVELMWLTGRLAPDFKTIADFRKDNGPAIRATCRRFIDLCRRLDLFTHAVAAIDGSKFKAVNARDKNFTKAKLKKRMEQVEASIEHYVAALETADRQVGFNTLRPQPGRAERGEHADRHDAAGVGQRDENSEDHRVDRLAARANDVRGRDRLAVTWRRRMRGARPKARRDEEQEFLHSGNRQLAGQGHGICH